MNDDTQPAAIDLVCDFICGALHQEQLRADTNAILQWVSELPRDHDVVSQRAFFVAVRSVTTQAMEEFRRNHEHLVRLVPDVREFMEEHMEKGVIVEGADQSQEEKLNQTLNLFAEKFVELADRKLAVPMPMPMPDAVHVTPMHLSPNESEKLVKSDIDKLLGVSIDTNMETVDNTQRSTKQSKENASNLN
jgi:hypothetical protein